MTNQSLDIQAIYRFFHMALQENCEALEQTLKTGFPVDTLHPLRQTTALMEVTRLGRADAAIYLLEHGASPGLLSGIKPSSPIHIAIQLHNHPLLSQMLAHARFFDIIDYTGATPLHMLAQYVESHKHATWLPLARNIIEKSNRPDQIDQEGLTALHYAAIHDWPDFAELLLQRGANPNAITPDTHISVLHMAALNQQHSMARLLLRYGANPTIRTSDGQTATDIMPDISQMQTALNNAH